MFFPLKYVPEQPWNIFVYLFFFWIKKNFSHSFSVETIRGKKFLSHLKVNSAEPI